MYKTYTIEGKKFNAVDLGKELKVTQQTARGRLKVAKTINELYMPINGRRYKTHIIEGKEFTSPEISKILNCSESTARARLNRCGTIKDLLTPLHDIGTNNAIRRNSILNENSDEHRIRKLVMGAW